MQFLNPAALWALAAVALPVAIHLFNKFQVQRVPWAAMRLLEQALVKNRQRLKFQDLFLLLLRCLFLILLVLAFARPVLKGGGGADLGSYSGSAVDAILLVDDSLSMGLSNGVETRFEQARDAALKILDGLGSGSKAALFFVSNQARKVVPDPTRDFVLLRRTLHEAAPGARSTDLLPGLQAAVATLKGLEDNRPHAIFLITDDQALGWHGSDQMAALKEAEKAGIAMHLIPVGSPVTENLSISAIHLDAGVPVADQPLRCLVGVTDTGSSSFSGVRVTLSVDRSAPMAEAMIPQIAPGETQTVSLIARVNEAGYHTLTASLPPDRLPGDNERTLAFQALEQVRALVIEGKPDEKKVDQESFFLANALVPVSPEDRPRYYLKLTHGTEEDLRAGNLAQYSVVFLAGVPRLAPEETEGLEPFVKQGGGLVIFPGPATDVASYDNDPALTRLLPAKLGPLREVAGPVKTLAWQDHGFSHPVTSLWNDADQGNLGSIRVNRYFPLLPLDGAKTGGLVVAAYADGQPAVMDQPDGTGHVILFSTPATAGWSNLPLHPDFIPFLQRLVGYLTQRNDGGLILAPGDPFTRLVGVDAVGKDFSVLAPGEKEEKRVAGQVELQDGSGVIRFTETELPGPYEIFLGAEPKHLVAFAVQPDPAEFDLTSAADAQTAPFLDAKPGSRPGSSSGTAASGSRALWLLFLAAAFAVAVLEFCLAHFFSRSR